MATISPIRILVSGPEGEHEYSHRRKKALLVGRAAQCDLVLSDPSVSSHHAKIEVDAQGRLVLRDLQSTNGSYIADRRCIDRAEIPPGQPVYIGKYRLQIEVQSEIQQSVATFVPSTQAPSDSLGQRWNRQSPETVPERSWAAQGGGVGAWIRTRSKIDDAAHQWLENNHSKHLLRGQELQDAREWLQASGTFPELKASPLHRDFIQSSHRAHRRQRGLRYLAIGLGVLGLLALIPLKQHFGPQLGLAPPKPPKTLPGFKHGTKFESDELTLPDDMSGAHPNPEGGLSAVKHTVIPGESLKDIATRYGVTPEMLRRWNDLQDVASPWKPEQIIKVFPQRPALPPQKVVYTIRKGDTLASLSKRFSLQSQRLREFNPGVTRFKSGQEIQLWVEPKLQAKSKSQGKFRLEDVELHDHAITRGRPMRGSLENGIQLPRWDELYLRAQPKEQFGSSHLIRHLLSALINFRENYGFKGRLVMGDISIEGGGHFPPHKSHQSGRDIDIWLPTLTGDYRRYRSGGMKRPNPDEADWFATWHLIEALVQTGEVYMIFLSYELQEHVHSAAKLSGRTDEELVDIIQYPRGASRAILRHSNGHIHHIHVRFTCPPRPAPGLPGHDHYDCRL